MTFITPFLWAPTACWRFWPSTARSWRAAFSTATATATHLVVFWQLIWWNLTATATHLVVIWQIFLMRLRLIWWNWSNFGYFVVFWQASEFDCGFVHTIHKIVDHLIIFWCCIFFNLFVDAIKKHSLILSVIWKDECTRKIKIFRNFAKSEFFPGKSEKTVENPTLRFTETLSTYTIAWNAFASMHKYSRYLNYWSTYIFCVCFVYEHNFHKKCLFFEEK